MLELLSGLGEIAYANITKESLDKADEHLSLARLEENIDTIEAYVDKAWRLIDEALVKDFARSKKIDDIKKLILERIVRQYDMTIEMFPRNPKLYHQRGIFNSKLSYTNRALDDFRKAIEISPEDPENWVRAGYAFFDMGEFHYSAVCLKKAIDLGMRKKRIFEKFGQALVHLKKYNEAIDAFKYAIGEYSRDPRDYKMLGTLYIMIGEYDNAINSFTEAINIVEGWPIENLSDIKRDNHFYRDRAYAFLLAGKFDYAFIDAAVSSGGDILNPEVCAYKGYALVGKGDIDKAKELFMIAITTFSEKEQQDRNIEDYLGAIGASEGLLRLGVAPYAGSRIEMEAIQGGMPPHMVDAARAMFQRIKI